MAVAHGLWDWLLQGKPQTCLHSLWTQSVCGLLCQPSGTVKFHDIRGQTCKRHAFLLACNERFEMMNLLQYGQAAKVPVAVMLYMTQQVCARSSATCTTGHQLLRTAA